MSSSLLLRMYVHDCDRDMIMLENLACKHGYTVDPM